MEVDELPPIDPNVDYREVSKLIRIKEIKSIFFYLRYLSNNSSNIFFFSFHLNKKSITITFSKNKIILKNI